MGSSKTPSNFEIMFEGDAVGLLQHYGCNHWWSQGGPFQLSRVLFVELSDISRDDFTYEGTNQYSMATVLGREVGRKFYISLTLILILIFDIAGATIFPRLDPDFSYLGYRGYEGGGLLGMQFGLLIGIITVLFIRYSGKNDQE